LAALPAHHLNITANPQSNAATAQLIADKVDSILGATGATHVDIITHSMGSLSARYYVRNLSGDGKVDALVSLGGPNHGTTTADLCFSTACIEMRPNSTFTTDLNSIDESWGRRVTPFGGVHATKSFRRIRARS
jgi:triacylglycerol lipase